MSHAIAKGRSLMSKRITDKMRLDWLTKRAVGGFELKGWRDYADGIVYFSLGNCAYRKLRQCLDADLRRTRRGK